MATNIDVYQYTEHELRNERAYVTSFDFHSADQLSHCFHYYAEATFLQRSQVIAADGSLLSIEPEQDKAFRHALGFYSADLKIATYDVAKRALYDADGELILTVKEPGNALKKIAAGVVQQDPDEYELQAPSGQSLAVIKRHKIQARLPWPLSIIEKLVTVLFASGQSPCLNIHLASEELEPALCMVIAVILHQNKPSNLAAQ